MAGESGRAPRAAIFGLSGPALTGAERAFLAEADPWGLILFARNIETPEQTRRLVAEARAALGRRAPVLIDQEGGRVQRLRPPHWRAWPAPEADAAGPHGEERLRLRSRLIAHDLAALGIDVNCAPMLDLPGPGSHEIVAARALGRTAGAVAAAGRAIAEGLMAGGVLPVIKHLPGHGRAAADSHETLPVVDAPLATLRATDFAPFRALSGLPLGMTAHVLYTALDPERPATLSPPCLAAIREEIGFGGCLMSDDLGMRALSGGMRARAEAALAAGCDLALHCSGEMAEMVAVAEGAPRLSGPALTRARSAEAARPPAGGIDLAAAEARYRALAQGAAA